MSRETLSWLNLNTLIGFTDKRGTAWHYRADLQADAGNHFPGAVPLSRVEAMFGFQVVPTELSITVPADIETMTGLNDAGEMVRTIVVPDRKAWVHNQTWDVLGIFSDGYAGHQYKPWLLDNVSSILGDTLYVSSAGLLKKGAIAWVEVSVPDYIETPEGVKFRPNLLATTSFDGSIATTYKRTVTDTVCDNTRTAALGEQGQQHKVKHTRNSNGQLKLDEARKALQMIHQVEEDFRAQVRDLCAIDGHRPPAAQVPRRDRTDPGREGPQPHDGGEQAGRAEEALEQRQARGAVEEHGLRCRADGQHLHAPRGHRARRGASRAQHAPGRHGRLGQARQRHVRHAHQGARRRIAPGPGAAPLSGPRPSSIGSDPPVLHRFRP